MKKTDPILTKYGKIQGYGERNLEIFKGINYAEAPVGKLRFSPPVIKKSWDDVLDATQYGPCAFQGYTELEKLVGKIQPESEDCLSLNIWTPKADDKKRPVLFWIHGGAFKTGSGKIPLYDGSTLAHRGDVVVVTCNYRIGALGFLYIPGITANVGILDQVAALEWVHDNIEFFGGDPDNVTIFGESAGGYSVIILCAMPKAKGLFKHGIAQSAPYIDPEVSDKNSRRLMKSLKIKKGDIDALRQIAPEKIIAKENIITAAPTDILAFRPLIDGEIIPIHPLKAFQNGDCKNIDLIIGTNLDEAKLFTALNPNMANLNDEEWKKNIIGILALLGIDKNKSEEIINTYKEARKGKYSIKYKEIATAILTDVMFRISTTELLEAQSKHQKNTYNYLFTWPSPGFGGNLGACHAIEIPFVFNNLDIPGMDRFSGTGAEAEELSEKIMDAWISFSRTGNPNHDGLPEWPPYDAKNRATMFLGKECHVVNAAFDKEREVWNDMFKI